MKKLLFLLFTLCIGVNVVFAETISPEDKIRKNVNIYIESDNPQKAAKLVEKLGETINSNSYGNGFNSYAEFTKRIDYAELDFARDVIRTAGSVTAEDENQQSYLDEYTEVSIRADSAREEFEKLTSMLEKSNNLQTMIFLSDTLSQTSGNLDRYLGRIRAINDQTGAAYVNIYISLPSRVVPIQDYSNPVAGAFYDSWHGLFEVLKGIALFIAYAFVPLVIIGLIVYVVRKKRLKTEAEKDEE
ncbi:hypothetical protein FACS1894188_05690 [Clostridia bacterium]|nr:hypothetical protein FACS1894188_05690 [Clostridia bacterium]